MANKCLPPVKESEGTSVRTEKTSTRKTISRCVALTLTCIIAAMTVLCPVATAASAGGVYVSSALVEVNYDGANETPVSSYFEGATTSNSSLGTVKYVVNDSDEDVEILAIYAVYNKAGYLVKLGIDNYKILAKAKKLLTLTGIDLADYPAEDFTYKVFFWDTNYVPFIDSITY